MHLSSYPDSFTRSFVLKEPQNGELTLFSLLIGKCLKSIVPVHMIELPDVIERLFEKLMAKLVEYSLVLPSLAGQAKGEFSHLLSPVVKENKDAFVSFRMEADRLEKLFWRYISSFSKPVESDEIATDSLTWAGFRNEASTSTSKSLMTT